jgi:FixJ family two-component response regulator
MGGRVLSQELARRYPKLPMIWMSGHPREVEFPRQTPGREQAFLMKPMPAAVLLDTVARVLEEAVQS